MRCFYGIDIAADGTRVVARLSDGKTSLSSYPPTDPGYLDMQATVRQGDPSPHACFPEGKNTAALADELVQGIRGMRVTLVPPLLLDSSASTEERARLLARMARELA